MHFINGFKLLYEKVDTDGKVKIFASKKSIPTAEDKPLELFKTYEKDLDAHLVKTADKTVSKLVYEKIKEGNVFASEDLIPSTDDDNITDGLRSDGKAVIGLEDDTAETPTEPVDKDEGKTDKDTGK